MKCTTTRTVHPKCPKSLKLRATLKVRMVGATRSLEASSVRNAHTIVRKLTIVRNFGRSSPSVEFSKPADFC